MSSVLGTHDTRLGLMRLGAVGGSEPPEPPPDERLKPGRVASNWEFIRFPGRVVRTQAPNPSDQTPIQPPARRVPPIDWMPVDLGNRVTRRTPKPTPQATPPRLANRRSGSSFPFVPEPGRARRGRPLLSDIGPDMAVMASRQVRAEVIPCPGRTVRSQVPGPQPEPEVLPRRPRTVREAVFGAAQLLWIRPDPRNFPKTADASPALPELCEYKPGRLDDADYLPTRIDECS